MREAGYGGSDYEVEVITHEQSPDIAGAVNGSAGDSARAIRVSCTAMPARKRLNFCHCRWCWPTDLTRLLTEARKRNTIPGLKPGR